ncbi:MAG: 2'-5' RNA ligase family protein [Candidatus Saccharimonadaceae bacterium]
MAEAEKAQEAKFIPAFFLPIVEYGQELHPGLWPQHVTLFPPLQQRYDPEFGVRLRSELHRHYPFIVRTAGEALFGPEEDIRVRLLEPSLSLQGVHYLIEKAIGDITHDETFRSPYNPHVRVEESQDLPRGASIFIAGLSIVEKRGSGLWTVVDKIGLKGELS